VAALVLANGGVFQGERYLGAAAVGVEDGRVVAVGSLADVRRAAGPGAEEHDLQGGLLAPAFHDAHAHPVLAGMERLRCDLSELSTPEQYVAAVGDYADRFPEVEWVRGGGWNLAAFGPEGPTAAALDAVVPDRPVFLPANDHHDAWVNSRALELAGVDEHTPDPSDGWVLRDGQGRPTGTLREAAMGLVHRHLPDTRADMYEGLLEAQRVMHGFGVVGWQDALLGGYAGIDDPTEAYLIALRAGTLTVRVRGALWWDRQRGTEQVVELVARREELGRAGLDAGTVKIMVDGIAETFTAAMAEPYREVHRCPCGDRGLEFLGRDGLFAAVRAAHDAGFQLHLHAIGDRAVHDALDALEQTGAAADPGRLRHQIAHLQFVAPDDRPRFGALGVTANIQGLWANADDPAVEMLRAHVGEERWSWQYPFGDLHRTGARLAGGSDWPVDTPDPIQAIHTMVNRRGFPVTEGSTPFLPDQAIDLEAAFAAHTSAAAWASLDRESGLVREGGRADLVVLDRDPFRGPTEEVGAAKVRALFVAGALVHS
jgi:predicted amidohydrolase YtcJ